jgi:hypothetical protein
MVANMFKVCPHLFYKVYDLDCFLAADDNVFLQQVLICNECATDMLKRGDLSKTQAGYEFVIDMNPQLTKRGLTAKKVISVGLLTLFSIIPLIERYCA